MRNRLRLLAPILLLVAWLALIGLTMAQAQLPAGAYETGTVVQPVVAELCPGETLTYEQSIHITESTMLDISREWCNRGSTCIMAIRQSFVNVVAIPQEFSGLVSHVVPASPSFKPGGLYEFRSGVRNGELSIQIVPFSIREDCEAKPK
jgi:hypothetical protein